MRFHWLVLSSLSLFLLASPAEAARLLNWRFDTTQNRLSFTTEGGVQPTAQLIANPTRLVIDLPGTTLGRSTVSQPVGGAIRSVRVGQFDPQTTRIVIELSAGYTLDPQQVQFEGNSPSQWTVQIPNPQPLSSNALPGSSNRPTSENTQANNPTAGQTQVENIRVTPDGLFIATRGGQPEVAIDRSRDRSTINIDLRGATLSSQMQQRQDWTINRHGVSSLQLTQLESSPPVTRVTLNLSNSRNDWRATVSNLGGIVLLPSPTVASRSDRDNSPAPTTNNQPTNNQPTNNQLTTIRSIELDSSGTQLLVRTDRPFTYTSDWDLNAGAYRVTIPSAQLGTSVRPPQPPAGSTVLSVRLAQEDSRNVVLLVQPAPQVQLTSVTQPTPELLALRLQRSGVPVPPVGSVPVPPPQTNYPPNTSQTPIGRMSVVIDPGHGGPDPGAVGIRGLRETDIVLDISRQVASLLEQSGVQVIMTRTDERDLDLAPRTQLANRVNATIFVSIHANAIDMSRPDVNGIETYYYSSGQRLAQTIHNSILQMTGARDRGVRQARFYVLRHTSMPAVLVETGFVTGAEDAPKLADPTYRSQMAAAIARGILQYLQTYR